MEKKTKRILGILALAGLILYLAFTSFANSISYYYEVSELTDRPVYGEVVNVNGSVAAGSINWNPDQILLTFELTDNTSTIDVVYRDAIPNNLRENIPVTATGIFYRNNTLVAHTILTKCPSKYEAAITNETNEA